MDLQGKCVLLGITGGIAAYKMAGVASALKKRGADVEVIMTRNATQFITPLTFETLTGHKCMVDTFDRDFKFEVTHIELAKKADVILVAPATANVIAKMAHASPTICSPPPSWAAKCPKLVSPGHEHRHAGKPHHPGQHSHPGALTASPSSPLRAGFWPATMWARAACRRMPSCWTMWSGRWHPRTWQACGSPSPPAPPRRPSTRCAA